MAKLQICGLIFKLAEQVSGPELALVAIELAIFVFSAGN